jgi:hypothetical protein
VVSLVLRPLYSLFTVQEETGPQSRYERNGGVKIRLLLLGIEIRLFNRSARGLVVCRKRIKHLLEICSRNEGLVKMSRHITEHFVHELALTVVLNERFINTWHCHHWKTAVYLNKELWTVFTGNTDHIRRQSGFSAIGYCENHLKLLNKLCGRNSRVFNVI